MRDSGATPDPQLLRGVLPMLILALLQEQESYGYELVERLRDLGLTELATGAVYPVLSRYERAGFLVSRRLASPDGPPRKYYAITAAGAVELRRSVGRWQTISRIAARGLETLQGDDDV